MIQKDSKFKNSTYLSVALFGTFDVNNYGDCLFPLIVKHQLTKRLGEVNLYLFSPTNRIPEIADYSNVYAFNDLQEIFREPPSCFIIGGGALIRTRHGLSIYPQMRNILYPYTFKCWLLPLMVASSWNCPCFLNAIGDEPPFDEVFDEVVSKYMNKADLCLVRDEFTQERLSQINVSSRVAPDSGFTIPEVLTTSEWEILYKQTSKTFQLPSNYIVVQASFYLGSNHCGFAKAVADLATNMGLPVVLLPISHHLSDIESLKVLKKVLTQRQVKTYLISELLKTLETSSILANSQLYIGTSLHGAIVSLAFGRPAVSFSVKEKGKHRGVLLAVGLEICHTDHADEIPEKAKSVCQMHKALFVEKIEIAKQRVNGYFDEMVKIAKSNSTASIPDGWRQKSGTGEVIYGDMDDFEQIKRICLTQKEHIIFWKNCIQYLLRQNFKISQCYDHLMFYLRRRNEGKSTGCNFSK